MNKTMNNEIKHTPAPWIIRGQDIIGNELNGFICTWSGRSANAALIAAAPEQHELLIEALDLVPRIDDNDPMAPALADWCRRVKALTNQL